MGNNLNESTFLRLTYFGAGVPLVRAEGESPKVGLSLASGGQKLKTLSREKLKLTTFDFGHDYRKP
jgi:hypothetical protein